MNHSIMQDKRNGIVGKTSNSEKNGSFYLTCKELPQLVEKFVKGRKALDYGCGPGSSSIFLKSLGLDVEGVDINEHMISFAKELDSNGKYYIIKSGEIPADNETYDLVYAGFVLPYVSNKRDLSKIVTEIGRVLKTEGTFITVVSNENTTQHKPEEAEEINNLASGSPVDTGARRYSFTSCRYYWTDEDYGDAIRSAKMKLVCKHELLPNNCHEFPREFHNELSRITIYIAINSR